MHLFAFFEAFLYTTLYWKVNLFYWRKKAMTAKHVRLSKLENFFWGSYTFNISACYIVARK